MKRLLVCRDQIVVRDSINNRIYATGVPFTGKKEVLKQFEHYRNIDPRHLEEHPIYITKYRTKAELFNVLSGGKPSCGWERFTADLLEHDIYLFDFEWSEMVRYLEKIAGRIHAPAPVHFILSRILHTIVREKGKIKRIRTEKPIKINDLLRKFRPKTEKAVNDLIYLLEILDSEVRMSLNAEVENKRIRNALEKLMLKSGNLIIGETSQPPEFEEPERILPLRPEVVERLIKEGRYKILIRMNYAGTLFIDQILEVLLPMDIKIKKKLIQEIPQTKSLAPAVGYIPPYIVAQAQEDDLIRTYKEIDHSLVRMEIAKVANKRGFRKLFEECPDPRTATLVVKNKKPLPEEILPLVKTARSFRTFAKTLSEACKRVLLTKDQIEELPLPVIRAMINLPLSNPYFPYHPIIVEDGEALMKKALPLIMKDESILIKIEGRMGMTLKFIKEVKRWPGVKKSQYD